MLSSYRKCFQTRPSVPINFSSDKVNLLSSELMTSQIDQKMMRKGPTPPREEKSMNLCWVILLLLPLYSSDAYKFLVYSPLFGYSHTHFMGTIADILTEAGHDV
ncbi:hypothetical protein TELCIR_08272, partial [Teladorsagia circumcincta]